MSLSDTDNMEFQPIDLGSLETFDEEVQSREQEPDFNRFQLLFDPEEFKTAIRPEDAFRALYTVEKQEREACFEPLIKLKKPKEQVPLEPPGPSEALESEDQDGQEPEPTLSPEELALEQGYQDGFDQGFAKGEEQGFKEGESKGFAKGEADGFKKGEAEGLEQGMVQGLEQGEKQGLAKGEQQAQEQASLSLDALKAAMGSLDTLIENLVDKHEEQLLELVFKIAQKAVMAAVDTNDDIVRQTILDALKCLARPEQIELSISPEDYEYVEMVKDSFFEEIGSLKQVKVLSDPLVARGGCRIETATGAVETDPETKLKAVYDALVKPGNQG